MSLKAQLQTDVKAAMRDGKKEKRDTLRMMLAAIKQVEIDDKVTLDDEGVLAILTRQAKQRRESMVDYEKAGRMEQMAEEKFQLDIIETYLPQMMSAAEIEAIAAPIVAESGVTDMKGMGQVMGKLMPKVKGKADGRLVNQVVRQLIQNQ